MPVWSRNSRSGRLAAGRRSEPAPDRENGIDSDPEDDHPAPPLGFVGAEQSVSVSTAGLAGAKQVATPSAGLAGDEGDDPEVTETASSTTVSRTPAATVTTTAVWAAETTFASSSRPLIEPTPTPPTPSPAAAVGAHDTGVSDKTEDLLIATGSICGTIFIAMLIFIFYRMRRNGYTFDTSFTWLRRRRWASGSQPAMSHSRARNWSTPAYAWGREGQFRWGEESGSNKALPVMPYTPIARPGTSSSETPFAGAGMYAKSISSSSSSPTIRPSSPMEPRKSFLDAPSTPRALEPVHVRSHHSRQPSSPTLPIHKPPSPRASRGIPTFRQFLLNRHISIPKVSRFSWTNSQPPQTPRNLGDERARESVSTSRSSMPRWRTVDSWVSQQAGRLRDHDRKAGGAEANASASPVPTVPDVPKHYRTETSASTATVFRHHPGTEVPLPRGSVVPSEILNGKMMSSAL